MKYLIQKGDIVELRTDPVDDLDVICISVNDDFKFVPNSFLSIDQETNTILQCVVEEQVNPTAESIIRDTVNLI